MADPKYIDDFLFTTRWHATLAQGNAETHRAPNVARAWQIVADALNLAADTIRDLDPKVARAKADADCAATS